MVSHRPHPRRRRSPKRHLPLLPRTLLSLKSMTSRRMKSARAVSGAQRARLGTTSGHLSLSTLMAKSVGRFNAGIANTLSPSSARSARTSSSATRSPRPHLVIWLRIIRCSTMACPPLLMYSPGKPGAYLLALPKSWRIFWSRAS
ncbi:hypothetical protein K438DRAFT_1682785 [Mycena galopus ATCC 62051]|nr:hypothetical protein K438DRAFT_1682785 [Mycena galopus ATCC 62051]